MIAEQGYVGASVQEIARRAGVGKDTLYRRWSGKAELAYEALFARAEAAPPPDTGTLAGDLTELAERLHEEFSDEVAREAFFGLLADFSADEQLRQRIRSAFIEPAREVMTVVVEQAVARGELRPDVDPLLLLDIVAGTVFWRVGILGLPHAPAASSSISSALAGGILCTPPHQRSS